MKSGIDTAPVDSTVRPQDDLFRHVNGTRLKTVDIPDDRATYGAFVVLVEEAEKAVRGIIEEAAAAVDGHGDEASSEPSHGHNNPVRTKIGLLYRSFMAEVAIDALGITPHTNDITRIEAVATLEEFVSTLGQCGRNGVSTAAA